MLYWKDIFHKIEFPESLIAEGRKVMAARDKQLIDETIWLFGYGMRESGYVVDTVPGGCIVLRHCENCKGSYSTRYTKNRHIYWACPHCRTITQGRFQAALWNNMPENRLVTDEGEVFYHTTGREVYDKKYRQSYIVNSNGYLTQDDIPDYILGRINLSVLDDAERRRVAWVNNKN